MEGVSGLSPWRWDDVRLPSPDGRLVVCVDRLMEIGMSGPTSGRLRASNGLARESCGASIVWSHDSAFLAVPEFALDRRQRLVVLSMPLRQARVASGRYDVLRLDRFADGVIHGVEGDVPVAVDVSRIVWAAEDGSAGRRRRGPPRSGSTRRAPS